MEQPDAKPRADRRPGCIDPNDEPSARRVSSRDLLEETDRLIIEHEGREYLLRITSRGKLILTR